MAFRKRAQAGCAAQKVGHVISTEPTHTLWLIQVSVGDFKFLMEHKCYLNICRAVLLRVERRGRSGQVFTDGTAFLLRQFLIWSGWEEEPVV